jgi:hypothetical protein
MDDLGAPPKSFFSMGKCFLRPRTQGGLPVVLGIARHVLISMADRRESERRLKEIEVARS